MTTIAEINPVVAALGRPLQLGVIGGGPGSFIGSIATHPEAATRLSTAQLLPIASALDCIWRAHVAGGYVSDLINAGTVTPSADHH